MLNMLNLASELELPLGPFGLSNIGFMPLLWRKLLPVLHFVFVLESCALILYLHYR